MPYPIVCLMFVLILFVPKYGIAAQPPSSLALSEDRCGQPAMGVAEAVVGPYPLHVIVTEIDYENATIDFLTEMETTLHVLHASAYQLGQLQIGDAVDLCIVEALHGEMEV